MPGISIEVDGNSLRDFYRRRQGTLRGLPQVLAASLNDATKATVPEISKAIRARVNIKQADLDPKITITAATPSIEAHAEIGFSGKRFSLKYFGPQQQKTGVSYRIGASSGFIEGAFIGRRGDVIRRDGSKFIKLYGPSPWRMLVKSGLAEPAVDLLANTAIKRLTDRLQKLFEK